MKRWKLISVFFLFLIKGAVAFSQQGTLKLDLNYKVGVPTGSFRDLVSKTSANGWEAGVLYNITDQIAAGFQTGFQDYYQKYPRQVYHGEAGDISAVISNSVQVIPLLLKGKYSFSETGVVRPYAALGLGGSLVQYAKYYGQFSDAHSGFGFTAQPEVGVQIPVGRSVMIGVGAAYNYLPIKILDANGLHQASAKVGISVPLRQ